VGGEDRRGGGERWRTVNESRVKGNGRADPEGEGGSENEMCGVRRKTGRKGSKEKSRGKHKGEKRRAREVSRRREDLQWYWTGGGVQLELKKN